MTDDRASAALIGGVALLERAINYTLGSLLLVTPEDLANPTPCRGWNLRTLLIHMNESMSALAEAIDVGEVDLGRVTPSVGFDVDLVASLRNRACQLLGAWSAADRPVISIGGSPLTGGIVTSAGAIEVAVHGWDVARACGRDRPIPDALAEELLDLTPLLVSDDDRPHQFGARVEVPPWASPGDRLLAFLGRTP